MTQIRCLCCPASQNSGGLDFSNMSGSGIDVAMGIMAAEWAVFLVLAWYFDAVLPTGG
jgi:hypothetical protein